MDTILDFIRHGEPEGGPMYRGRRDDPLSEDGWGQMRAAVGETCPWTRIITSPLIRCQAFATELSERLELPMETRTDLQEIGFGAWEGRTAKALMEDDEASVLAFWRDPVHNTPPGAEPFDGFRQRVDRVVAEIVEAYRGEHLLIVAHGGVIRSALMHTLGMGSDHFQRLEVPYACLTRIKVGWHKGADMPWLVFHNGALR